MKTPRPCTLLLGLLLLSCATSGREAVVSTHEAKEEHPPAPSLGFKIYKMPNLSHMPGTLEEQGPFTCTHEKAPPPHPDADALFQHALWLYDKYRYEAREERHAGAHKEIFDTILRLYRIAAAWGHVGAVEQLVHFKNTRFASFRADSTAHGYVLELMAQGSPRAYYLMGQLVSNYGYLQTPIVLQFLRQAADAGNAHAQHYFGNNLCTCCGPTRPALACTLGPAMTKCAAEQGHAQAALSQARTLQREKQYDEALQYAQAAVKGGNLEAARWLAQAFLASAPEERNKNELGLAEDTARAERYAKIADILYRHSSATVDEVEHILPLPPAPLPAWDGEIEWLKRLHAQAPPLPSEARIAEMAHAKGLEAETGLPPPPNLHEGPPFVCTFEKTRTTPYNPEADMLFRRAEWLHKKNQLKRPPWDKEEPEIYAAEIERLSRIAAAWGHDKAASNLALLLIPQSPRDDLMTKPVEIAEALILQGIPRGYYLMGLLLNEHWGLKNDALASLEYFRRAAELGDMEAQNHLGNIYAGIESKNRNMGKEMLRCAADQGHAQAAFAMAKYYARNDEALKYFQLALKAGEVGAADALSRIFHDLSLEDTLSATEQAEYKERVARYERIAELLFGAIHTQVEEIEEIVPLPPAKLPKWDGKLHSLKKWEKHVAPPLPSAQRIEEMARAKGLHPHTGQPLKNEVDRE